MRLRPLYLRRTCNHRVRPTLRETLLRTPPQIGNPAARMRSDNSWLLAAAEFSAEEPTDFGRLGAELLDEGAHRVAVPGQQRLQIFEVTGERAFDHLDRDRPLADAEGFSKASARSARFAAGSSVDWPAIPLPPGRSFR